MKIPDNITKPCVIMTSTNWAIPNGLTSHQLYLLKSLFHLPIQDLRIVIFKLMPLVIVQLIQSLTIKKLCLNNESCISLVCIVPHLRNLEELNISRPPRILNRGIELSGFLSSCPVTLKTLEIHGFRIRCDAPALSQAIPQLRKLTLKYHFIENTAFQYISDVLGRDLRTLTLISRDSDIIPILLVELELHMLDISMMVPREIIVRTAVDCSERRYPFQDHRQLVFRDDDLINVHPRGFVTEIPWTNEPHANTMCLTFHSAREIVINDKTCAHFEP